MKGKTQQDIDWKEILYLACLCVYIITFTMVRNGRILTYVHPVSWEQYVTFVHVINGLLVVKIIFDITEEPRIIGLIALTEAVGFIVYRHNSSDIILAIFWFLCASKNVRPRKITECLFWSHIVGFMIMTFLGLIDVVPFGRTVKIGHKTVSYAFGFSHPNVAAAKIFQIVLLYWLLRKGRLMLKHYIGIIVAMAVVKVVTDCSTVLMLMGLLLVITVLYNLPGARGFLNRNINRVRNVFLTCYLGILGIMIGFCCFCKNEKIFKVLGTFGARISQAIKYYKYYGLSLWGQPLMDYKSNPEGYKKLGLYTLDNGYMHLLLAFGIVLFLYIIFLHVGTIWWMFRRRRLDYVIVYAMFFIYGFLETNVIRTGMNFTLFYLFGFIWEYYDTKISRKNKSILKS